MRHLVWQRMEHNLISRKLTMGYVFGIYYCLPLSYALIILPIHLLPTSLICKLELLSSKQRSYIQIQTKMILKLKRNFRKSRKHMRSWHFVNCFGQELVNNYDVKLTKFTKYYSLILYDRFWKMKINVHNMIRCEIVTSSNYDHISGLWGHCMYFR